MGTRRFSGLAVVMSIIGAALACVVGEGILSLGENWPDFLTIGVYFGIGAMLICSMIFVSQRVSPRLIGYRWKEMYFKTSLKLFVPTTLVLVGVVAGILELIYGLEINEPKTIDNIVIAVDRSSSMDATDPEAERFKSMSEFIDNLKGDKKVAVMTFNENPTLAIDFTAVQTKEEKNAFIDQIQNLNIKNDGQTGIANVVHEAYNLMESKNQGSSLILISDGAPTDGSDSDIPGLVQDYVKHNIPIYTIGMMYTDSSSETYLQEIATLTGGTYYSTSDTTMLNEVFGKIRYNEEKGTIITPRTGAYAASSLHKVLRVIFLMVISMLISLGLGIMFDNKYLVKGMIIGAFIGGLIGGCIAEKLFIDGWIGILVRLTYWLFIGVSLMSFTWSVTFKDNYHGTRTA